MEYIASCFNLAQKLDKILVCKYKNNYVKTKVMLTTSKVKL